MKVGDLAKLVDSLHANARNAISLDRTATLRELYEVEDLLRTAALEGNHSNAVGSPGKALTERQPSKKRPTSRTHYRRKPL